MLVILLSVISVSFLFVDGQLPEPDTNLNIYALPVGQGDCTVVQCTSPHGKEISIIDAGSSMDTGFDSDDLVNYITGQDVKYILLTHPDKAHINYVDKIFDSLRKAGKTFPRVYHSCEWSSYTDYVTDADAKKNAMRVDKCCGEAECMRKAAIKMCRGSVNIAVIGSEQESCSGGGGNGDSVVSIVYHGARRLALMPGDFEGPKDFIDNFLKCATFGATITAPIYRLAHQGAYNGLANTHTFLNAIGAKYVISSSGLHVDYKHPRCELHDYYTDPNHPADTVPQHDYYCFDSAGTLYNKRPNKAIYTTTMITPSNQYTNYIIQLACNPVTKTIIPYEIRYN